MAAMPFRASAQPDRILPHDSDRSGSLRNCLARKFSLGVLPRSVEPRAWAGKADNAAVCALCDSLIVHGDNEFEVEWREGSNLRMLRFHVQCFWLWSAELER
jgi:hypothetical protein